MKRVQKGKYGHIAVAVSDVDRAIYHLTRRGALFDEDTRKSDGKGTKFIYLRGEIGGFAIHLVRK